MNTFRHSGKLGDILYSLPAIKALGGGALYIDCHTQYLGKPPLGKDSALLMVDLVRTQDYVNHAALYGGDPVDYDFDRFREKAVAIHAFNCINSETDQVIGTLFGSFVKGVRRRLIPRFEVDLPQLHWDAVGLPGLAQVDAPWLTGIPPKTIADIIVSKTDRHPGELDWPVLRRYRTRCAFVGLESEWRAFCTDHFRIDYHPVTDLVEFAQVVAGAKLFVGNQSFGLALADSMLIPRAAQLWDASPNRLPPLNAHCGLTRDIVRTYIDL